MKKVVLGIVIAIVVMLAGWMYYNKPHRSVADADFITIQATQLFEAYQNSEDQANKEYLNKVLKVSGVVASLSSNSAGLPLIMLTTSDPIFGINCTMDTKVENINVGDSVVIKGICTGYLSDVVMVQCQLQQEK